MESNQKSVSFVCQENGSNKEYHIQMTKSGTGYVITFQYGAIGQTLKPGSKTPGGPIDEVAAEKLFQKLIKERLSKGYTQTYQSFPGGEIKGSGFSAQVITEKKTHGVFPQLLNTIEDDEVMKYINDDKYVMEEKKDGERRMLISFPDGPIGLNKKGQEVQLPNSIKDSVKGLYILDGEIIGDTLFVFDTLAMGKLNYRDTPLIERLRALSSYEFGPNIVVVKTAETSEEKLKMYNDLKENKAEGVVFKLKSSKYVAGRPNSGGPQLKNKFYKEASFIVKDLTKGKRSVGLELISENGERVHMGKCTIPPNKEVPEIGAVVEIRYLYAYRGGCIFQPNYKEPRTDVDVEECLMTQIVYKAGQPESDEEE